MLKSKHYNFCIFLLPHTPYPWHKQVMNYLTYILVRGLLGLFGLLPLHVASAIGGVLAQLIGPFTKRHDIAHKNMELIYPDQTQEWRNTNVSKMWNHLGRVFAELPALKSGELLAGVEEAIGKEHLNAGAQVIYVSAHLGQWELLTPLAKDNGSGPITEMYRHINNQRIDALLKNYRVEIYDQLIRKKGDNAIALVRALKQGNSLALLIDQRLTKGDQMAFLGVEAGTNTAAIKMSIKTGIPIAVASIVREQGVNFKGEVHAPIYPPESGSDEEKAASMSRQVFDLIEQKIRAHPDQYMWTHDRWK